MKNIKVFCIFIISLIHLSCAMQNHNNENQNDKKNYDFFPSIIVGKVTSGYKVITKDSTYIFQLKNDYQQGFQQDIVGLLNKRNLFLVKQIIENTEARSRRDLYLSQSLFLMDMDKKIVDTLYELKINKNEISMTPHISKDDSLLFLFIDKTGGMSKNKIYQSPVDLVIINIENGEVKRINNFYTFHYHLIRGMGSDIVSPDNKYLVYSIFDRRFDYERHCQQAKKSNGLYIYNVKDNNHKKILDIAGKWPIWSRYNDFIAYIYQGDVYFYYFNSKNKELLYKSEDDSRVWRIQWHPSGEYIYIQSRKQSKKWIHIGPGDGSYLTSQLFDIESGEELDTGGMFDGKGSGLYWR